MGKIGLVSGRPGESETMRSSCDGMVMVRLPKGPLHTKSSLRAYADQPAPCDRAHLHTGHLILWHVSLDINDHDETVRMRRII